MLTETTEPPGTVTVRSLRALIALSLACAFGIFAFAAAMGFTGSKIVAEIALGSYVDIPQPEDTDLLEAAEAMFPAPESEKSAKKASTKAKKTASTKAKHTNR